MENTFRYTEDVENWLADLTYGEFWYAVEPYKLILQPFDHCEREIERGFVTRDTVLSVLKFMAVDELKARYSLRDRPVAPWLKVIK